MPGGAEGSGRRTWPLGRRSRSCRGPAVSTSLGRACRQGTLTVSLAGSQPENGPASRPQSDGGKQVPTVIEIAAAKVDSHP